VFPFEADRVSLPDADYHTNDQSTTNSRGDGSSSSPNGSNTWHQRQNNRYHYELNGTSAAGTGERTTYIWSAMWGTQTDSRGKTTNWGNSDPKPFVDKTEDFSWPNATATTTWQQIKEDFQRDPYAGSTLQIGFGVIDVIAGAVMTLGTCGGAVVPGLGLIVVGVDQIAAGINNAQNPGSPSMSVLEYGGYSLAKGLGASENTAQTVGAYTPAALSLVFNVWGGLTACFAAGTPLLTPEGEKPIEQFKPGDWVLSAPEGDPEAPPEPRQVEEVFTNLLPLLNVRVGGKLIQTTSEHPFYVRGKGWAAAKDLQTGDLLRSHDGQWVAVESATEGEELAPVYNLRVAEHHTYFVGSREWEFSVWAHNACNLNTNSATSRFGIYEIFVNGTLYKIGKADLMRITQSSGLPTRLHQQIRRLIRAYGANNVSQVLTELGTTTTQWAKAAETAVLRSIFDKLRMVPPGNIKSFFP